MELLKQLLDNISLSGVVEYLSDNISKIIAIALAPLIQKILLKAYQKMKFLVAKKNYQDYKDKTEKITKICDKLLFKCSASRVLFIALHNGDVTFSNLHLCKATCLVESLDSGIASTKADLINVLLYNTDEYFKNTKSKHTEVLNIEKMKNDSQHYYFKSRGVKSYIEFMVAWQNFPIGFLRLEFCQSTITPEQADNIIKAGLDEAKMLTYILKP